MNLVGIDEVGRGCWAGPLVAAAVLLPNDFDSGRGGLRLRDSKKMTKRQRQMVAERIEKEAVAIGVGWVWPEAIDSGGITAAVKRAMAEALQMIQADYDEVIIDGHLNYLADAVKFRGPSSELKISAVIRADDSVPAVSAASIVAKVARDKYMEAVAAIYPDYGFEKHVGYGTAAHIAALNKFGVTELHRRSYRPVRALLE
jgi:ribonuclease HII